MKEFKISIIIVFIISLILISIVFAIPAHTEAIPITSANYYSKLVVVVNSNETGISLWEIECRDNDGNMWCFLNDTNDLEKGDILTLLMFRLNENEEDDECIEYTWEGYTENLNLFFEIMEWC